MAACTNLTEPVTRTPATHSITRVSRLAQILAPIPLLALMAWWLTAMALNSSPTLDEVPHIGAGVSYLQKQDLRLNGEHPPLAKVLAAIPLVATGVRADYRSTAWTASQRFFPAYLAQWVFGEWVLGHWNNRMRTTVLARLPMILLTLTLAVVIYSSAVRIFGLASGILCLTLVATTPLYLTFGPLVLTDIPAALFTTVALLAFAAAATRPTPAHIAVFGVALASALLVKFSAALILIAIPVALRYTRAHPVPGFNTETSGQVFWRGLAVASAIVYATYFVLSWNQPFDVQHRIGTGPVAEAIGRALMPPWLYLRGVAMVLFTSSRPAYLFGEVLPNGVPVYFPTLLLLKSTPGFLGILALAAVLGLQRLRTHRWTTIVPPEHRLLWRTLWISAVMFSAACLASGLNIGFRHFSIPLTLLILLLAPTPALLAAVSRRAPNAGKLLTTAAVVLAGSSLASVALAYPNFLPYTNMLTFGKPPYYLIGDSNLDWNQALPQLAAYADQHRIPELLVDNYGLSDPSADIPNARVWDCQAPSPSDAGRFAAVSANSFLESHNCRWLLPYIQQSIGGGSMYVLKLPSPLPPAGSPGGPPSPEQRRLIFGLLFDMRTLTINLTHHPEQLPTAFAELEKRFVPESIARRLYPPDEPVHWPWDN